MNNFFLGTIVLIISLSCKKSAVENTKLLGAVFGTSYSITYNSNTDYSVQFDSLFYVLNKSMSTYQYNSDISKLNRNDSYTLDSHFIKVYNTSKRIYNETNGAFDPTIGSVVNAWDFGPEGEISDLDSLKIDSLMLSVGFNKVKRNDNLINKPFGAFIDFNAIAKGYAVDVVSEYLESKNINNYLVEIGGEIRVKGKNVEKNLLWRVGIENPNFDGSQSILKAITLKNESMATSGTYRKFKIDENGMRYAHIINPKTGYPSKTNILSVSVITKKCMDADAYATAFKAMGIKKVKNFLKIHPEIKAFLVFEDQNRELQKLSLNGFPEA